MTVDDLHDLRLATSYPGLVGSYLKDRGVITRPTLDGAVETAIRLGVADAIADVVETEPRCDRQAWSCSATRSWNPRRC